MPRFKFFKKFSASIPQVNLKYSSLNRIFHLAHDLQNCSLFSRAVLNQPLLSYQIVKRMIEMCNQAEPYVIEVNCDQEGILEPPLEVLGMKTLDRDKFKKDIKIPSLLLSVDKITLAIKKLKPFLLKMRRFQPIIEDTQNCQKLILLNPVLVNKNISKIEEIVKGMSLEKLSSTEIQLCYENWNHESIFKAVVPPEIGSSISSFSNVGHIIHLNLKPHLMDYKFLIGQVLLDKFSNTKTVVNKLQEIGTEFRNFHMEVLAGEPNFSVLVKENGHQYAFDFSKVFWNPRLVNEHDKIVKKINQGDLVYDVFAGVGPFAIPAAKKMCHVHANDLNPDSHQWLCHNAKLNKVDNHLKTYNLDGREFISNVIKNGLVEHWSKSNEKSDVHIIMNLPASALEFLNSFEGLLKEEKFQLTFKMPIVYCYCFIKKDEAIETVIKKYFDADLQKQLDVAPVRLVAPNKTMMRITFAIPKENLFGFQAEPQAKKIKLHSEKD